MTCWWAARAAICVGMLLTGAIDARAECVGGTICEYVNQPGWRMFLARSLHPIDDGFGWRVHVTRNFVGTTRGDVDVFVNKGGEYLGPASLTGNGEYLLTVRMEDVPGYRRILSTGISCGPEAIQWTDLEPAQRDYLEGLPGRQRDGKVFGVVMENRNYNFVRLNATRVFLYNGKGAQTAVATTDQDGRFEFTGLAAGRYRVAADLPPGQFALEDDFDGNAAIVRHGCQAAVLSYKRRDDRR